MELVAERLNAMFGNWTLADGPMLRGPGTVAVSVGDDHTGERRHLDLAITLNVDRPEETTISDCVTGISDDTEEAIRQAIEMWAATTASAVCELLVGDGRLADHFRGSEPGGFPGWHMIAGGITGWGLGDGHTAKQQWFLENQPWVALAHEITEGLDREYLNGVKFFIGGQGDQSIAEVRINGRVHERSSRALLAAGWPRTTQMTTARAFVLLVHREDSH